MKSTLTAFIDSLLIYDYLLFGAVVLFFILLLLVAVMLRRRLWLSVLIILTAFVFLVAGPVVGHYQLHHYLFKNSIEVLETKELEFSDALLIQGNITNLSERPFAECTIKASAYKVSGTALIDWIFPLNPFAQATYVIKSPLEPGAAEPFKILIEPFYYEEDYNITTGADCR